MLPNPVPAGWPPSRLGLALAFDADRGRLVLFGGVGLAATTLAYFVFDDVWESRYAL